MKRAIVGIVSALMLISAIYPSYAIGKLELIVSVGEEHPFLPGYQFGTSGTLGDVWNVDVEVLDTDGDPAEGAIVRFYLGKKSVGTSKVGSNGVAEVRLMLNKVGIQTYKVIASDNDPSGKGEAIFKLRVNEPKIVRVFTPVKVCEDTKCLTVQRPNAQLIMDAGCNDATRYWHAHTAESIRNSGHVFQAPQSVTQATWPFTKAKKREPMYTGSDQFPFAQWIIDQATVPVGDDQDVRGFYDGPVGESVLCQADSGELIVLK